MRAVKISNEPLLKDFFYSLSDKSLYRRFISVRINIPHERLQDFVVIDNTKELVILAKIKHAELEEVAGLGQYTIRPGTHSAEVALIVKDDYQNQGIRSVLLTYLTQLALKQGLLGFTAEVLVDNQLMLRLFEKMGFDIKKRSSAGDYELKMAFRGIQ